MENKPKILWLLNTHLPYIADAFNLSKSTNSGWLVGAFSKIKENKDIDLVICFPFQTKSAYVKKQKGGVTFYGFGSMGIYNKDLSAGIASLKAIIKKENPDLVHIFGTEYSHTLAMVRAFDNKSKTVISIQGLCSVYAEHYLEGLSKSALHNKSLPEMIRNKGLIFERDLFIKRGEHEISALKNVSNVMGRTSWDKACTSFINKDATYYKCNESLRAPFYKNKWQHDACEKNTIFMSQGDYSIKGLHYILEALLIIKTYKSDVRLYVAGGAHVKPTSFLAKLRLPSYPRYIQKLIKKYDLQDNVVFTGLLGQEAMCDRFLKSNVFVSCSTIENSPNSLGEAMLLGVPCVSSNVGGVSDLMVHNKEGFIYQSTAPYMLAHFVLSLFDDSALCKKFSAASRRKANKTHDIEKNTRDLLDIYSDINKKANG
jgi:glycosyltransferase involved in cell wall biosynthesis